MRLFRRSVSHPDGELRYGVRTRNGRVVEFVVQLYCWVDDEWHVVAQFDHNPGMGEGHDVTVEGVHADIFHGGRKRCADDEQHPGPVNPEFALDNAINYLTVHDERLIERDLEWQSE